MKKKYIRKLLAMATVFTLIVPTSAGCGNGNTGASSNENETATEETSTEEAASEETSTDETAAEESSTEETATDETATEETATDEDVAESSGEALETGIPLTSKDITVRWGDQYGYYLLPIILEEGWFEDVFGPNNITIDVAQFGSGPEMIEAFTTDAVDLGVMGVQPTISGKANGAEITTVAAFDDGSKASVIATPAGNDINSIADLKGKNVGVTLGTIFHSHLVWALNEAGVDPNDVNFVNIDWTGVGNIVEQGDVDAAVGDYSDFYNTSIADNFEFNYLGDATGSGTQDQVIVGRTEFINEHQDVVENLLVIFQKAADFLDEHPEEALTINAEYFGMPEETIQAALDTNDFGIYGGEEFRTNYDNYIQFMYDNDLVLERIDVDSLLDYTCLDATGLLD